MKAEGRSKKNQKATNYFLDLILVLLSIVGIVVLKRQNRIDTLAAYKIGIVSIFMMLVFMLSLRFVGRGQRNEKQNNRIRIGFAICYVISFVGVILEILGFAFGQWMIGAWVFSIVLGPMIGAIDQLLFCMLQAVLLEYSLAQFVVPCLIGCGFCFVLPYMRKKSNLASVFLVCFMCKGIGIVVEQNFLWKNIVNMNFLFSQLILLGNILLCGGISWILNGWVQYGTFGFMRKSFIGYLREVDMVSKVQNAKGRKEKLQASYRKQDFFEFINLEQPILKLLRKQCPEVYGHSIKVARAAKEAAKMLACNEELCYSAGLLHEIGRLSQGDYLENSCELLLQNNYPEEIVEIIRQHNVKGDAITSKEAAIVMLADSVVAMCEKIKSSVSVQQKKEMIQKLFVLRFEQDTMKQCEMRLDEYKQLQDCFQKWMEKEEKNDVSF